MGEPRRPSGQADELPFHYPAGGRPFPGHPGRVEGRAQRPNLIPLGHFLQSGPPARAAASGRKDVCTVFIAALVLDAVYQVIVHSGICTLELLPAATTLALLPYVLIRGRVTRLARRPTAVIPTEGLPGNRETGRSPAPRKEG